MTPISPKIIFFDIDDTLYDTATGTIGTHTAYALRALQQRGIIVAIATGRTPAVIPPPVRRLIEECGIALLVCINGQYVQYHGKTLTQFTMSPDTAAHVSQRLRENQIAHAFVSPEQIATALVDELSEDALNGLGLPRCHDPEHHHHSPVCQMLAFYPATDDAKVRAMLPENLKTVRWHKNGVDILDCAGSKARGIQAALDALNLSAAQAMAFGDGNNDREMFAAVGFAVAMGNAAAPLKALADHIAPHAADDGVYRALVDLGLIAADV